MYKTKEKEITNALFFNLGLCIDTSFIPCKSLPHMYVYMYIIPHISSQLALIIYK